MGNPVVVIFLTFQRTGYALRTIRAARERLKYDNLLWYLADDGSAQGHIDACLDAMKGVNLIGQHTLPSGTYGANANKAWDAAHSLSSVTLWLEDDWELREDLEIAPLVSLLENHDNIGMVRMGYLQIRMRGAAEGYDGKLYLNLDRVPDAPTFTGHPSLRHRRFRDAYGPYREGLRPGETELAYAESFYYKEGPGILWPLSMRDHGPWHHIGEEKA